MIKGSKTKPAKPKFNQILSRSRKEEGSGFFEAALLHHWIPLEFKVKEIVWNSQSIWPDGLNPRIKEIKEICNNYNLAKLVIYSTSTIKKDKCNITEVEVLTSLGLSKTVKDIRNCLVHEGALISKAEYGACKKLINGLSDYLDNNYK